MTFPIYEPVSQCNICGLDFPESELMRHYRTGRLVDRLCNDERTASDNLAILKRPNENRRRAKQPVPSSEESSGVETRVLSLYPQVVLGVHYTIITGTGTGVITPGAAYLTGSIDVATVGVVAGSGAILGLVWGVQLLVASPRPVKSLVVTPVSANTRALPVLATLVDLLPAFITLLTTVTPLTAGEYYEWEYAFIY